MVCDKVMCIFKPVMEKACVCVAQNGKRNIARCTDCKSCDKSTCICLKTGGAESICFCSDDSGNIIACDDCCCTPNNQGVINERSSKCVCLPTYGKSCICVCQNEKGEYIRCDDCECKEQEKNKFRSNGCPATTNSCVFNQSRKGNRVCVDADKRGNVVNCSDCSCALKPSQNKKICSKPECICIPSDDDKSCVCVCQNREGYYIRCSDCVCANPSRSHDDRFAPGGSRRSQRNAPSNCVCLPTYGKTCICVCQNEKGEIIACDDCCCSSGTQGGKKCCLPECVCLPTNGKSCICVCQNDKGEYIICDDCECEQEKKYDSACCKKTNKRIIFAAPSTIGGNLKRNIDCCGCKREIKVCSKTRCVCISTEGRSCICVCQNEEGEFVRCDDCQCGTSSRYETARSRDDCCAFKEIRRSQRRTSSKCVCLLTHGKSCICVCQNEKGEIITCDDCCCTSSGIQKGRRCCLPKCVCLPTNGKSCICVCQDDHGEYVICDDCECKPENKYNNACCGKSNKTVVFASSSISERNRKPDNYCCRYEEERECCMPTQDKEYSYKTTCCKKYL